MKLLQFSFWYKVSLFWSFVMGKAIKDKEYMMKCSFKEFKRRVRIALYCAKAWAKCQDKIDVLKKQITEK